MPTIFLSYRRSDTGGEAGHLSHMIQQQLGGGLVFRDVDNIPPGTRFPVVLEKELAAAKVVLVLIGPTWLAELKQRLKQPDIDQRLEQSDIDQRCKQPNIDYLRVEVASALAKGKRVIPVLLKGAALPPAQALPEDLVSLAEHHAMTLRDESWSQDVGRLIDAIGRPYRWNMVAVRAVVAVLAIVVAVFFLVPLLPDDRANDITFLRILVASLTGIYLLVEFVVGYRYFKKLKRGYQP